MQCLNVPRCRDAAMPRERGSPHRRRLQHARGRRGVEITRNMSALADCTACNAAPPLARRFGQLIGGA
ncbi:hypothetical protein WS68_23075 [Burkholderia sp. TSV86]|nr:hypothetical protein WS68_23075 [Burkholderia sp. TSV86]